MSAVIEQLLASDDPVEVELGRTLQAWQNAKVSQGKAKRLGYEPRDFRRLGARQLISERVMKEASGFEDVDPNDSYEAIVCKFPTEFSHDVVVKATRRLDEFVSRFGPTADISEYEAAVAGLEEKIWTRAPRGIVSPVRVQSSQNNFVRDPLIKAFVLKLAKGKCELCSALSPFTDSNGRPYLELHHVKYLSKGGSDRISNAVAVCPNCHRALHHASDKANREKTLYQINSRLIRED